MSEDDRAAKAARAKALLAKKQRQKKAAESGTGLAQSSAPSRTESPAPSETTTPVEPKGNEKRDISSVFGQDDSGGDWLSSLPRASSPPSRVTSASPHVQSKPSTPAPSQHPGPNEAKSPLRGSITNETAVHDKIRSLESVNMNLQVDLKRLQDLLSVSQNNEALLQEERGRTADLQRQCAELTTQKAEALDNAKQVKEAAQRNEALLKREKERAADLQSRFSALETENGDLLRKEQNASQATRSTEAALKQEQEHVSNLQKQLANLEVEKEDLLKKERQTIEYLVGEKASLKSELERLEGVEARWQSASEELEAEHARSQGLESQLRAVQDEVGKATIRISQYESNEKDVVEKSRDLERQLQRMTAAATESRKEAEETGRRLQELTEQVQNDDRVEKLETSLKHTQDRADELEFQLSKLKQVHAALKSEKDALETRSGDYTKQEGEWKAKVSDLESKHSELQARADRATGEHDGLVKEVSDLRGQLEDRQNTISKLEEQLKQATSSGSSHARQIQTLQNELRSANRRAEESEKTIESLQQEGTSLMKSLDEMRPKIVELTDAKLDLAEQIEGLQRSIKNRDVEIAKLESSVDQLQSDRIDLEQQLREAVSRNERETNSVQTERTELQKGYSLVKEELDTALASIKNLEAQRASSHQDASRRLEEIDRLTSTIQSQGEELTQVKHELDARMYAQDEEQDLLDRAQNEVESLRTELAAKDEELDRLREVVNSPTTDGPRSLDEELLSSIRQQHAIEISSAQSQIRSLENQVFEAQAKSHELQKQVTSLQAQTSRQPPRTLSPVLSRPSSRAKNDDLRRASFNTHRPSPHAPSALSRTIFDQALSPETMHKRKVSLSMLKVRIDSEVAHSSPLVHSRALSPVHSNSGREDELDGHGHTHHAGQRPRPQFLDESHVFWCSSCQGDLVIL